MTPTLPPKECSPGEMNCVCKADGSCDGGAVCSADLCVGATLRGLSIDAQGARSCEIMLKESGDAKVLGATYSDGISGALRRQAPNVAVALAAEADADLPGSTAQVQIDSDSEGVSVESVRCFDNEGAVIDGAQASFE